MAKWWPGKKPTVKPNCLPADGVAGWRKNCVVSRVLMGWHHLTRCLCVHTSRPDSCFSASEVVWRRLEWICLFSCQALSVRPYWTNSSPVRRRRPIDHWWRCSAEPRLIRHHVFTARREWRVSLTLTYFKTRWFKPSDRWSSARVESSGRTQRAAASLCLLIAKCAPCYSGWFFFLMYEEHA